MNDREIVADYLRSRCGQPDMEGCIPQFEYENLEYFEQIDIDEAKNERVYSFVVEAQFIYSIDLSDYYPWPAKPDPTEKDTREKAIYDITLRGNEVTDLEYHGALEVLEVEE